jgi:predicted anti-sigma-YlaC factor YlaD
VTVFRLQPRTCDRAREWVSLRLDSELSELEQALLTAHLERCAACAAYAAGVETVTGAIRAAATERLRRPVTLPRRPRFGVAARALQAGTATAAVLAAAVGLGTLFGSVGGTHASLSANAVRLSDSAIPRGANTESDALLKTPRLAMLKAQMGVGKQRGLGIQV